MKVFSFIIIAVLFSVCTVSQTLPDFSFASQKKERLTPASLPENKPVIVYYFDPYCDKCVMQAAKIKDSEAKFANITIICVSIGSVTPDENEAFRRKHLTGLQNLFVCIDDKYKFDTWFGYSETPSIYVYNKARQRTAVFSEVVPAEEILNACSKTQ